MPIARWIHRHVIYPVVVGLRGEHGIYAGLAQLGAMSTWSADTVREHQAAKLKLALAYAYVRCPLYRRTWPEDAERHDDPLALLKRLPLLEKHTLQKEAAGLRARPGPGRVMAKTTGGSTGQAVTVLKDRRAVGFEMAASWFAYGWFGVGIGDRGVRFWGQPFSFARRLRFAAVDLAMNRIRFSAFAFDEGDLERYWRRCRV